MSWLFRTKKKQAKHGWFAVKILPDRINVVCVERFNNEKPQITFCRTFSTEGNADILKLIASDAHAEGQKTICLLNDNEYQLLIIESPNVPEAELKLAARWAIKNQINHAIENITIDILPVPSGNSSTQKPANLYVVTAHNDVITERQLVIEDAGFNLSVIDIPELAQRNLAALIEEPERGLALLTIDAVGSLLTVTCDSKLYLSRRTDINLTQILIQNADQQQWIFERLALDIQRTIDYFDRHFSSVVLNRLALALIPKDCGLVDYLINNLSLTVNLIAITDLFIIKDEQELNTLEQQTESLLTLGAALRLDS